MSYVCPICGKEFEGIFSLYGHMQIHRKELDEKTWKKLQKAFPEPDFSFLNKK